LLKTLNWIAERYTSSAGPLVASAQSRELLKFMTSSVLGGANR